MDLMLLVGSHNNQFQLVGFVVKLLACREVAFLLTLETIQEETKRSKLVRASMSQTEKTEEKEKGEIEESSNDSRSVGTRVPEVEIHVFRRGKGPIEVLKSKLVGYEQDQLDVRDILDKYSFKSIFAFNPNPNPAGSCGRGLAIRFNSRNGRSILTYRDGATIYIDGEPKDSLIQPVTKISIGVAVITILIALVLKETPAWIEKFNIFGGSFPPWILACVVIVFTRMRKRTKDLLKKYGW